MVACLQQCAEWQAPPKLHPLIPPPCTLCRHAAALPPCRSKDIKVCGLLGPASALEKKGPLVSDQVVGVGGTTAWKLCTLSPGTTLAVVFDIVAQHGGGGGGDALAAQGQGQFFLQFVTRYLHDSGAMRCRVTTVTRRCAPACVAMAGRWGAGGVGAGRQCFRHHMSFVCIHQGVLCRCCRWLQVGGGQQPGRPHPRLRPGGGGGADGAPRQPQDGKRGGL